MLRHLREHCIHTSGHIRSGSIGVERVTTWSEAAAQNATAHQMVESGFDVPYGAPHETAEALRGSIVWPADVHALKEIPARESGRELLDPISD